MKKMINNKTKKIYSIKSPITKKIYSIKSPITKKSFSPEVNQKLTMISKKEYNELFGCGAENKLIKMGQTNNRTLKILNKDKCISLKSKRGKEILKSNMNQKINCNAIIGPTQKHSNCWFNTLFVTFFLSDKGRKFTKHFRHTMINGKKSNGKKINPPSLRNSLLLLNIAIDACLNSGEANSLAIKINTNTIIHNIYQSLPITNIYKTNEAGNPIDYYLTIINYLKSEKNTIFMIEDMYSLNKLKLKQIKLPDIVIISYFDNTSNYLLSCKEEKKEVLYLQDKKGKKHKYILDSSIIRDNEMAHFASTLTCNKKLLGYDGESDNKINRHFNWKKYINKDYDWTFEGSMWEGTKKNIYWNYKKGYSMLFYYRVD